MIYRGGSLPVGSTRIAKHHQLVCARTSGCLAHMCTYILMAVPVHPIILNTQVAILPNSNMHVYIERCTNFNTDCKKICRSNTISTDCKKNVQIKQHLNRLQEANSIQTAAAAQYPHIGSCNRISAHVRIC